MAGRIAASTASRTNGSDREGQQGRQDHRPAGAREHGVGRRLRGGERAGDQDEDGGDEEIGGHRATMAARL
jgi:hypothetical protein